MERTELTYPDPPRNPRRVRAGEYEVKVAAADGGFGGARKERRPIHIHTTKVMSHALARELRSRAHNLIEIQEADGVASSSA